MGRFLLICVAMLILSGCGWLSSSISASSIDQNAAIQETDDKLLIINILRARDKAPIHFGDIPKIDETLQLSAGVTPTVTFGPHTLAATNTVAAAASVQESPSFEMDNLDTQEFITGIMSPIKPKLLKYWLDRGLDPRIVMLVFVSSVTLSLEGDEDKSPRHHPKPANSGGPDEDENKTPPKERISIANFPYRLTLSAEDRPFFTDRFGVVRTAYGIALDRSEQFKLPFLSFLKIVNWLNGDFFAVASPDVHPVGPPLKLDAGNIDKLFGNIARIDPKNYELDTVKHKKQTYQLNTVSEDPKITLCFRANRVQVSGAADPKPSGSAPSGQTADKADACADSRDIPAKDARLIAPASRRVCASIREFLANGLSGPCVLDSAKIHVEFTLRSTGDIIYFLGALLELQAEMPDLQPKQLALNNPVTLGYCGNAGEAEGTNESGLAGCNGGAVLFNLARGEAKGRLHVAYRDETYTVPEASDGDHTLEVLAILTQLINLNKSGKDLRGTPTIRLIP